MQTAAHTNSPAAKGKAMNVRIRFAGLGTVRALKGCNAETVFKLLESGKWRWVFNVARKGASKRELRFLWDELANPQAYRNLSLSEVINDILPPGRPTYTPGEMVQCFMLSRTSLMRLRRDFGWPLGNVPRASVAAWLRVGWIGRQKA
jgi:hypothetical protein